MGCLIVVLWLSYMSYAIWWLLVPGPTPGLFCDMRIICAPITANYTPTKSLPSSSKPPRAWEGNGMLLVLLLSEFRRLPALAPGRPLESGPYSAPKSRPYTGLRLFLRTVLGDTFSDDRIRASIARILGGVCKRNRTVEPYSVPS